MNRLIYILPVLLTMILVSSCDKNTLSDIESDPTENGGLAAVTFSVMIEQTENTPSGRDRQVSTRTPGADTDDPPTRCFMQVMYANGTPYDNKVQQAEGSDNYTFTVSVPVSEHFVFLFYADNGTATVNDLTSVVYQAGTVAFAARLEGTAETVSRSATLKHIVTKLTLQHNGTNTFTAGEGDVLTATIPCAETYNVFQGNAKGNTMTAITHTFGTALSTEQETDIFSCYTIVSASGNRDVTVNFHFLNLTIPSVPIPADTHIVLKGDLSEKNDNWTGTQDYYKQVFTDAFFKDGKPFGQESFGTYYYWASDATNRRIINDILKTTAFGGEYKTVTAPWEERVYIGYLPSSMEIGYNGISIYIFSQPENASIYPNITLPDKIH